MIALSSVSGSLKDAKPALIALYMINKFLNLFVPPRSQEAFTSEAAEAIAALDPSFQFEVTSPLEIRAKRGNDEPIQINLSNAYLNYLQNRTQRRAIISTFIRGLIEADVDTLIPKNVIPTIKDKAYLAEVRQQIEAKGQNPNEYFVSEGYNEELSIVYAVDSPSSIRFLNPRDLPQLNLAGRPLREFAVENLKKILPPVEVHGNPPLFSLKSGGMFESSLLLFDKVWNKEELRVQGEIIVAVPSREVLLVADGSSEKAVSLIAEKARQLASRSAYSISSKLFVRKGNTFELLK